ncbi:MAG: NADH:ubiquinone reductase (Na(+)-transporting) subunit C [Muribaculaceae bacterium]|nr:NADH:ubiquinone reductase (Na(+)-transporting) subunit C [Muribaculaceae bacterium]
MNKNSNSYQILYAAIMVIVVGAVLALVATSLKPRQQDNIANDTRKQILSAIHQSAPSDDQVEATFNKFIVCDYLVDTTGAKVDTTRNCAFDVNMKTNIKEEHPKLPVFEANVDGATKYIIPMYGAGLWGPIWGYVAVNDDGKTIYGAYFSHASETPGLGAEIESENFQKRFNDKTLRYQDGQVATPSVEKKGTGDDQIDAVTGATITSKGVDAMFKKCLAPYAAFFASKGNGQQACDKHDCEKPDCDKPACCQQGECKK